MSVSITRLLCLASSLAFVPAGLADDAVPPPSFTAAGVVHGATFTPGPVAPGLIVSIFGSRLGPASVRTSELLPDGRLSTSLAGVRVWFDGVPAPILFVSAEQVSAIVPYATAGKSRTAVQVEVDGRKSDLVEVPVTDVAPGIFTVGASGRGQAAMVNWNGTLNTPANGAPRDSVVTFFATGAGQTDPPGADDGQLTDALPQPAAAVRVFVGGAPVRVEYAGPVRGLPPALLQVTAYLPEDAPLFSQVFLELEIAGKRSPAGVTFAIR
jgi:uncharacterized protein (TIGR03437 family)